MPFKSYRRHRRRARRYVKTGLQVYRDVNMLKGLLNTEFKFKDSQNNFGANPDSVTSAGTFYLLNGIGESVDYNGRTGRTIRIKSMQLRADAVKNSSAAAVSTDIRVILFWDMQPNGGAPSVGSLLETGAQSALYAFRNLNFRHRYKIVMDKRVTLDIDDINISVCDFYRRCNQKVIYGTNGDTIAAINTGSLYLLTISNETSNTPTLHFNSRIRYIDN